MSETVAVTPSTSMRTFFTVWGGQLGSFLGSAMSAFGLQLWVYAETGSVTNLALVALAFALPAVLISPFAGALVDRWDRRKVMLASDAVAGVATLCVAGLYATDSLHLWHIYVLVAVGSMGSAFQAPAWLASIPLLVPKPHLGRANGLVQLNDGLSLVMAPALAGVVLVASGLGAILLIDVATFLFAVGTLAVVRFPRPEGHAATSTGSMLGDAAPGGGEAGWGVRHPPHDLSGDLPDRHPRLRAARRPRVRTADGRGWSAGRKRRIGHRGRPRPGGGPDVHRDRTRHRPSRGGRVPRTQGGQHRARAPRR